MPETFLLSTRQTGIAPGLFAYDFHMMNWLWGSMLLLGLIACMMSGNAEGAMEAMLAGAGEAVTLSLSLAGAYMLWMGLMNVAKEAGLIDALARAVQKPLALLFPNAPGAVAPITLNLAANFFGMGSAATPFGLAAMKELRAAADREGVPEGTASDDMCMFLSLNSSAVELLPTSVLALRAAAGAADVYCVVLPTFIASLFAFASAVVLCKLFCRRRPPGLQARTGRLARRKAGQRA